MVLLLHLQREALLEGEEVILVAVEWFLEAQGRMGLDLEGGVVREGEEALGRALVLGCRVGSGGGESVYRKARQEEGEGMVEEVLEVVEADTDEQNTQNDTT